MWCVALVAGACFLPLQSNAQEKSAPLPSDAKSIDEILVIVNRSGKIIDVDAIRLEEIKMKVLREFNLEQTKQEQELSRLKLRGSKVRNTSRVAWGYDAQKEAARLQYSQAKYLPIDRVRPATILSVRF